MPQPDRSVSGGPSPAVIAARRESVDSELLKDWLAIVEILDIPLPEPRPYAASPREDIARLAHVELQRDLVRAVLAALRSAE